MSGDQKTGDGAGMLVQIPHNFLKTSEDFKLPEPGRYGSGFFFLPKKDRDQTKARIMIEMVTKREGGKCLGWRNVPTDPGCLGQIARETIPSFWQVFVTFDG